MVVDCFRCFIAILIHTFAVAVYLACNKNLGTSVNICIMSNIRFKVVRPSISLSKCQTVKDVDALYSYVKYHSCSFSRPGNTMKFLLYSKFRQDICRDARAFWGEPKGTFASHPSHMKFAVFFYSRYAQYITCTCHF